VNFNGITLVTGAWTFTYTEQYQPQQQQQQQQLAAVGDCREST